MKLFARKSIFSLITIVTILFAGIFNSLSVFALPEAPNPTETTVPSIDLSLPVIEPNEPATEPEEGTDPSDEDAETSIDDTEGIDDEADSPDGKTICQDQSGPLSWILCSALSVSGKVIDGIYELLENILIVDPISNDHDSPIFILWQYTRNITNVIFVIFMLIVIYSQLTGFGISNYGIKRVLPRIIIAAVLVNLSYIITVLAVDISNIVGSSLLDTFTNIQDSITFAEDPMSQISWTEVIAYFVSGAGLSWLAVTASGGMGHLLWMLAIVVIGAIVSLLIGLLTIALRQGVILILVMIAPLAFVCYLLPNTERWFKKWKDALFQMLIFFPMFSFLFGASKLASWAIIASSEGEMFRVILGLAIRVMPLFMATSLLKMSGTILGKVSSALGTAAKPIYGAAGNWANSNAEVARRKYLASNNVLNGSRLRNYLAYRQEYRNLKIKAGEEIYTGRAKTRALLDASSYKGRNEDGTDRWGTRFKDNKANSTTRLLKEASLQGTLAATAQRNLDSTLSEYGDIFEANAKNPEKTLGHQHAQAYLESMMQQFRAENIAQGDQSFLVGKYLNAVAGNSNGDSREYNRLIKNAASSLGHIGESTIMGQVILRSSEIEGRRRREVGIVMNKFNIDKRGFRAMALDKGAINDDGIELDENGEKIEDMNYKFKEGMEAKHRNWDKYIGRHKETGKEIDKSAYDSLSDTEKEQYQKIRYMEILDDKKNVIQRVYSDDAAYMKEMLIRDINIGDPINRRYNISYGTGDAATGTSAGILRQYHSTISAAMLDSRYKEHAAEVTPMLTSQANLGYINTIGQYHVANLQSLSVATKPGAFFQNDAYAINSWAELISSLNATDPKKQFDNLIKDSDIDGYRDVNGNHLKGLELIVDENGNKSWKEVSANQATTEQRRNFVKHNILPRAARKLTGMLSRSITPNMSENIKPDGYDAIKNLAQALGNIGEENFNESLAFEDRLNPENDIFDVKDYSAHLSIISQSKQAIEQAKANYYANHPEAANKLNQQTPPPVRNHASQNNGGVPFGSTNNTAGSDGLPLPDLSIPPLGGSSTSSSANNNAQPDNYPSGGNPALGNLGGQLQRNNSHDNYVSNTSNSDHIIGQVTDILHSSSDFFAVSQQLSSYAHTNPRLFPIASEIDNIIESIAYQSANQAFNSSIGSVNGYNDNRLEQLEQEIISYLYAYL